LGLSRVPPYERLLNGSITSVCWRIAFVLKEPIGNPSLSACQVDSSQFRLPCALKYARFYDKILFKVSKHCFAFEGQNMKLFVDVALSYIVAPSCLIRTSMLLLITDRIFILIRFFFGDAVAYVFLEMFLSFFQQFDRLASVSRTRFIGLFLDPLSILAPHDSNLTI